MAPAEALVPLTAKPAEVVAVQASQPAPATPAKRMSRRAQRRATRESDRLAAERAAIAARESRRDRKTPALDKREREHVDWVQHLISLPNDPTLSSREK